MKKNEVKAEKTYIEVWWAFGRGGAQEEEHVGGEEGEEHVGGEEGEEEEERTNRLIKNKMKSN